MQMVRMANLSVVGSHSVNGVAALHTKLLKKDLFPEFDALYPGKFNNKTNGITPRRWLLACNPRLSELITSKIGHGWERDLDKLRALEAFADDLDFQIDFMTVKHANKVDLARIIKSRLRRRGQPRRALRRADQAPARIQAPAPQSAAHPRALSPPLARPRPR